MQYAKSCTISLLSKKYLIPPDLLQFTFTNATNSLGMHTKSGPHLAYLCFGSTLFNERGLDQSLASHAFFGDLREKKLEAKMKTARYYQI